MRYKLLGKTGLRVSELCLGAMSFGTGWGYGSEDEESKKVLEAFVNAGGNFIDTADNYLEGASERLLGELIHDDRDRFVIASKCTLCSPMGSEFPGDPNATGNSRKHMREAVEKTLKRLNTDYLDVLYVHVWDFLTPVEEVMRSIDDLVRSGKVNYAGVSNAPAHIVAKANTIAEFRGWTPFAVYEGLYNLLDRSIERDVMPMIQDEGMALTCWQPLSGAMLSGDEEEIKIRVQNQAGQEPSDAQWEVIRLVGAIAKEVGASPAQVALNWIRQHSGVVIPIMGVRMAEHIEDNLKCLDWELSEEQLQRLNAATSVDLGYPGFFLAYVLAGMTYNNMLDQINDKGRLPGYFGR